MPDYAEYRFWSAIHDREITRISMADARGQEFFMFVPEVSGRAYREARAEAISLIREAIAAGLDPGEVRVMR